MQITENAPIDVSVYRSTMDGALVVEVDTLEEANNVRIHLNDGKLYDGDPNTDDSPVGMIRKIAGWLADKGEAKETNAVVDARLRSNITNLLYRQGHYIEEHP